MTLHVDFWVAAATVAPVLGLAATVLVGRSTPRVTSVLSSYVEAADAWSRSVGDSRVADAQDLAAAARAADQRAQLASMQAQSASLNRQLAGSDDPEARGVLRSRLASVQNAATQLERDLAAAPLGQPDYRSLKEVYDRRARQREAQAARQAQLVTEGHRLLAPALAVARVADLVTALCWLICTGVLAVSLFSLSEGEDLTKPAYAAGGLVAVMAVLIVPTLADTLIGNALGDVSQKATRNSAGFE